MTNSLKHSGVKGMRWGFRKDPDGLGHIPRSTRNLARKDAKRHIDAKMFYGETAGTKRKLLKADIDRKRKTINGYGEAFDKYVTKVDTSRSAKKAIRDRNRIDTTKKVRSFIKNALGITGSLTVAAGSALYLANKEKVDRAVINGFNMAVDTAKRKYGK